jgi:hypothetical protein
MATENEITKHDLHFNDMISLTTWTMTCSNLNLVELCPTGEPTYEQSPASPILVTLKVNSDAFCTCSQFDFRYNVPVETSHCLCLRSLTMDCIIVITFSCGTLAQPRSGNYFRNYSHSFVISNDLICSSTNLLLIGLFWPRMIFSTSSYYLSHNLRKITTLTIVYHKYRTFQLCQVHGFHIYSISPVSAIALLNALPSVARLVEALCYKLKGCGFKSRRGH